MKLNIFIDLLQRIMKDINRKGLIDAVKIYLLKIDTRIFDYKYNVNTHKDSYLKDLKFDSIKKKKHLIMNYANADLNKIDVINNPVVLK